jgi:hypothetical protein
MLVRVPRTTVIEAGKANPGKVPVDVEVTVEVTWAEK